MSNTLHDSVLGEGSDVVVLHGLFGQGANLGGVARALQDEFRVHSPDLPDHGHSPWLATASIPDYAAAISRWMDERQIDIAHFVGHSLGGKVAMELALSEPARVDRLVVADIAPVAYGPSHEGVFAGMAAVAAADCRSRAEAATVLGEHIVADDVIQFLLMSLKREAAGRYTWRLSRAGLETSYPRFLEGLTAERPFDGETLFIRGAESDYVADAHIPRIESLFAHCRIETIAGTGHWLHAERPSEFNALVLGFLL